MKVLLVIDHFGSGGAQRQLVNLAIGLKNTGHDISIFIYYPEYDFYRNFLEKYSIRIIDFHKEKQGICASIFRALRNHLKTEKYDVAIAYLDTPSIYLIISAIGLKTRIVVSDRSSYLGAKNIIVYFLKRQIFRMADIIVTNSETQKKWLVKKAGLPGNRVIKIYNGFDPADFTPVYIKRVIKNDLKLIAIGGVRPEKNIESLILALELFNKKHNWLPRVSWVGKSDSLHYKDKLIMMLENRPELRAIWNWSGERSDIPELLANHHALVLPSYYEGLPNVVCEALFAGKPVIVSNVCDNPILIEDNVRGFLFDPKDPHTLADAIERLNHLSNEDYRNMSFLNRSFAEKNLSVDNMTERYISLFAEALK